jgi:hypothetical protein
LMKWQEQKLEHRVNRKKAGLEIAQTKRAPKRAFLVGEARGGWACMQKDPAV